MHFIDASRDEHKTRIATRTGLNEGSMGTWERTGKQKKNSQKRDRRQRLGMWAFTYTPGHIQLDHRWAFFVLSGSADLQEHFRDVRICSSALSAREYQCSGCGRSDGGLDGHLGKGETTGNSGPRRHFCTIWTTLFFRLHLLLLFSFFTHFHFSHLPPRNTTTCTTFHTVVRGGSAVVRLGGETRASQSGATRCPPSNTTNDAAIGQKRNIPTLLRRWLCPPSHGWYLWPWESPRRTWGRRQVPGESETFLGVFGNHEPRHQPTPTNFKHYVDSFSNSFSTTNNGTYAHRGRAEPKPRDARGKKGCSFLLPASHESKESHT